MKEDDKKMKDAGNAKEIMSKIDPELLSAALSEMMIEADEAEGPDVEETKKALKKVYDSIPEGKDKASIMSKAIRELDADVIEKEVKVVKERLATIDRETLIEAAKDYIDVEAICKFAIYCKACISYVICGKPIFCKYPEGGCKYIVCKYPEGGCKICINYAVCKFPLGGCKYCIDYSVICKIPEGCGFDILCKGGCPLYKIYECRSIGMPDFPEWEIDPVLKEKLKAEIIQELLQSPEINRAMKKMLTKIKEEG